MTTVLVHGSGPRMAPAIERFHREGCSVEVLAASATPELDDLAARGAFTYRSAPDPWSYDEVYRVQTEPVTSPPGERDGTGRVVLVGGGPGDPRLLTTAGLDAVRSADVVVCDRLAPLAVLDEARPSAEILHVGKIPHGDFTPQEAIDALLVERARRGLLVVRLKGGDGFVFGRGGEEWQACTRAGVPVEVIPGVSSAVAVPALAGVPVTHRGITQGFVVVSGHVAPDDPRCTTDWAALARSGLTLVVLMGLGQLRAVTTTLHKAGLPTGTPVAVTEHGASPAQRTVTGWLTDIAARTEEAEFTAPAVVVIGDVVTALTERA